METNVYTFDDAGRLLGQTVNGQVRTYGYDFQSRMTSLTDTNGSVFSYAFDGEGNRIRQSLNDCLTTRFVYDGANAVVEMNGSNQVVWAYVNGAGMDQPIERIAFINGTARNRQVYHADGLGSVAALSDEGGEPVQTYAYAAFGGIRAQTGTDLNRVTFTAREAVGDSLGFFYYRNRAYDPNTGRFTSEDPLGFVNGANRYVYCGNNPVNRVDPDGKFWLQVIGAAIGATVNAIANYDAVSSGQMSGLEYAGSILLGAGLGALSPTSLVGTLVTGAAAGAANNLYNQLTIDDGCEGIDTSELATSALGGLAGAGVARGIGGIGNQILRGSYIPYLMAPATYAGEGAVAGAVAGSYVSSQF